MKILVVGPYYFDNMTWSTSQTLKKMGHDVSYFDSTNILGFTTLSIINKIISHGKRLITHEPEKGMNRKLIKIAQKINPKLIIIIGGAVSGNISPKCIDELKSEIGCKIVCWFVDHLANLGRQYILASEYDALFFKDSFIVEKLRKNIGKNNVFLLHQCCDPNIHKPVKLTEKQKSYYGCDIAVVGNMYYYRTELLKKLKKYNIKIWGANPPSWLSMGELNKFHMRRVVWGEEKVKAFLGAKIVLNNNHYAEILGVNKRTFEAAACGGFQITDNLPALEDLFIKDKEIITYDDLNDLMQKIEYYIDHPDKREKITKRASNRALNEHTYENRLEKLLKLTGF